MFYCGETKDIKERLNLHNTGFFKTAFTSKVNDWILKLEIPCKNRTMARKIEAHIKRNGTRAFKQRLINEPDLVIYLINKYS